MPGQSSGRNILGHPESRIPAEYRVTTAQHDEIFRETAKLTLDRGPVEPDDLKLRRRETRQAVGDDESLDLAVGDVLRPNHCEGAEGYRSV
jgi:hypothetical protein